MGAMRQGGGFTLYVHSYYLQQNKRNTFGKGKKISLKLKTKTFQLDNLPDMLLWEIEMHGLQTVINIDDSEK